MFRIQTAYCVQSQCRLSRSVLSCELWVHTAPLGLEKNTKWNNSVKLFQPIFLLNTSKKQPTFNEHLLRKLSLLRMDLNDWAPDLSSKSFCCVTQLKQHYYYHYTHRAGVTVHNQCLVFFTFLNQVLMIKWIKTASYHPLTLLLFGWRLWHEFRLP